ncbi:HNH endonuclease [Pseudomonas sp. PDM14]|uniref:HNH endonuclease n=1 Tax=Pseudomonas sp. PDM14 TaxID=2769288 RepID=UPI001CE091D5|nr:HNH endonuclease [Pseudomonas sp. PDM14]
MIALGLAKQCERGELSRQSAYAQLIEQHGFAGHTANAYLNCYKHLRNGTPMKATVSAAAIRLMLDDLLPLGPEALLTALQALMGHIQYLEGLNSISVERGLRAVHQKYMGQLAGIAELESLPGDLERRVQASITDSPSARAKRLAEAVQRPGVIYRVVREYDRNPDVVAEVLLRANGHCERCSRPAPFVRRRDSTPYLEVHHVQQLAHGGDDTVANAIALCPNCHRESHFGNVMPVSKR